MESTTPAHLPYRGRLAPSPTGYLHLGHGKTFFIAWERAQKSQGEIFLRIEDLDPQRSKPEYIQAALDDFKWMGIDWDGEPMYQSQRYDQYLTAWNRLKAGGYIYPCDKSRKDIRHATTAPHAEDEEALFPTAWRGTQKEANQFESPSGAHWRFRVPDGKTVSFEDQEQGPQSFTAGQDFGDFVIWRNDDVPAYELAVVVDDIAMGITEIVRGKDLLHSTARQILIYQALGAAPPNFCHLPLVTDKDGRRLAKRHHASALKKIREQGSSFQQNLKKLTGLPLD